MKKEIERLQNDMVKHQFDAFLVETADDHQSEYVGDYFKVRAFLSGFTGSAGTLLVTQKEAYLWTDGRYFIQAEKQLENSGIQLMRMGQKGVKTLDEKLMELPENFRMALDLRTVSADFNAHFQQIFPKAKLIHDPKVIDELWPCRPRRSCEPIWDYDVVYCGKSRKEKIALVKEQMASHQAKGMLLTSLDDISWLLNIRGADVKHNPVALSYVLIDSSHVTLYVQMAALSEEMKSILTNDGISLRPYESIYDDLELYDDGRLWYDPKKANAYLMEQVSPDVLLYPAPLPTTLLKSIKNDVEIANTKKAHLYDGLAVTKWMYWLKKTIKEKDLTELEISEYLEKMR